MDYRSGCLVGTIGQELANQNDVFRSRVAAVFKEWHGHYENCFREAQQVDFGLDEPNQKRWISGFGIVGAIALVTSLDIQPS